MIVLSVRGPEARQAAEFLADPPRGARAVEVRLDLLATPSLRPFDDARWRRPSIPRIATCRGRRHGGGFRGTERERTRLLGRAVAAGFAYADVEAGTAAARALLGALPGRVILSWHDRRGTPRAADLIERYRAMAALPGVAIVKIVTTARGALDALEIRELLAARRTGDPPLVAFAMGCFGVATRILAPSWGSWGTYVASGRGGETAAGQITLEDAVRTYRIRSISAATRLTGLVGDPVTHSLSPAIHNAAYRAMRMDWLYLPLALERASDLPRLFRGLGLRGASVTAPHKIGALRCLSILDRGARRAGACNTVVRRRGRLAGWNTDIEGVSVPLKKRLDPRGRVALVLGDGGAARAAAVALDRLGARVVVASRSRGRGEGAARLARGRWVPFARARSEPWEILINATPIGSDGRKVPVPVASLRGRVVGDLVYRPGGTPLVRAARKRRIPAFGGEEVLLAQALAQFRLFTGRAAPVETMKAALARLMRRTVPRTASDGRR